MKQKDEILGFKEVEKVLKNVLTAKDPDRIKGVGLRLKSAKMLITVETERSRLYRFEKVHERELAKLQIKGK